VRILDRSAKSGQNILTRGREMRRGETILQAGATLRPQELGLLATVGATSIETYRQPTVALISTGDELVEPAFLPAPGQIRNSNAPMLLGQAARAGAKTNYLGISPDTVEDLRASISDGLKADFLLLSGGVSAGKFDLVPSVLAQLGVQPVFHQVAMKPGKPLFFGRRDATLVFGLPGNPVSSMVGFELFVRPALRIAAGRSEPGPMLVSARMSGSHWHRGDRPTYHPSQLALQPLGWEVTPAAWFGSADLRALSQTNSFALFAPGEKQYQQGETVQVLAPELQT
jgi:molybdopterin molybdotransferase